MQFLSVIKAIIVWSFTKGKMQNKECSQTEENRSREFHSQLAVDWERPLVLTTLTTLKGHIFFLKTVRELWKQKHLNMIKYREGDPFLSEQRTEGTFTLSVFITAGYPGSQRNILDIGRQTLLGEEKSSQAFISTS